MNFDRIAPNVRSIYVYHSKQSTKTVTHRKFSYTYKLMIILEGSLVLHVGKREQTCEAGDIVYLPACCDYVTDFPCAPLHLINIEFDMLHDRAPEVEPRIKNFAFRNQAKIPELYSTVVTFDDIPAFNEGFVLHHILGAAKRARRCLELYGSRNEFSRLTINTQITELLIRIAEQINQTKKPPTAVVAERVTDYIEAHYMEKLTCERIAAEFSYHPASLNRIMREFCQCSLHEAIIRAKINGAIRLLMESDMSVTDIAYHLSFYDSAHFTKVFREVTGCNPSDVRKKKS